MKFNGNPFGGSRVVPYELNIQTDVTRLTVVIRFYASPLKVIRGKH